VFCSSEGQAEEVALLQPYLNFILSFKDCKHVSTQERSRWRRSTALMMHFSVLSNAVAHFIRRSTEIFHLAKLAAAFVLVTIPRMNVFVHVQRGGDARGVSRRVQLQPQRSSPLVARRLQQLEGDS